MFNLRIKLFFVLFLTLGIGIFSKAHRRHQLKTKFLQLSPLRVSVSTYLSAPASTESSGCFLDTINEITTRLTEKEKEYSDLCSLAKNPQVQVIVDVVNTIAALQGNLALDPKYALKDSDIAKMKGLNTTSFNDILSSLKLTEESLEASMKKIASEWDVIATSSKYPIFLKQNVLDLANFVHGLMYIKTVHSALGPNDCLPVNKKTIMIFEQSLINLVDKEAPLQQKEIIDNKVIIDPLGFTYGGYALAFWIKEDNSKLLQPIKYLQSFIGNKEALSFSIADGSIIHNLVIDNKTLFVREQPSCTEMAFIMITIEKDCEKYKINLIVRLSNTNLRFIVSDSFPAEKIENIKIAIISKEALNPMLFANYIQSDFNEDRVLSALLQPMTPTIVSMLDLCKKADPVCLYHSIDNLCQVCDKNQLQYQNKCYDLCPNGTMKTEELQCEECAESCEECEDIDTCIKCIPGMYLNDDAECVTDCPSNEYPFEGNCVKCDDECVTCLDESTCSKCMSPFVVSSEGKCVEDCPIKYYKDLVAGKCIECAEGCDHCSCKVQCIECSQGYFNLNGKCVKDCGDGYMEDALTKKCLKCIDNCKECTKVDQCDICNINFLLSSQKTCVSNCEQGQVILKNVCIDCLDKANCLLCDPNNTNICLQCQAPKALKNGQCVTNCGDYFYKADNNECVACLNNCKQCTKTQCLQCDDGKYILNNEKCVSPCPDGFIESGSQCVKCDNLACKKCDPNDTDICTQCYDHQFLKEDDCVLNCGVGFFENEDKCEKCINGCDICLDAFTCVECDAVHFLSGQKCVEQCGSGMTAVGKKCEKCSVGNCETCSDKTICDQCKDGKLLYNNECYDSCPMGSFMPKDDSDTCEKCKEHCLDCLDLDTCQKCEATYVLQGTACQKECNDGYYADTKNTCVKCNNEKCKHCPHCPSTCTECIDNLVLFEGDCLEQCPAGTYRQGNECNVCQIPCGTCVDTADNCSSCINSFSLQEHTCVSKCDAGYTKINGVCQKCTDLHCESCSVEDVSCCVKPIDNLHFIDQCDVVERCPDGKFPDANNHCQQCLTNCQECNNAATCQVCKKGFFLKNGNQCVESCGEGMIESNGVCVQCSSQCNKCKADDITCCTQCHMNEYVFKCQCLTKCPIGYYPNGTTCSPCQVADCAECVDLGKTCTKCTDGHALLDGLCVLLPCPEGTVEKDGKCERCIVENCEQCLVSTQTCTQCEEPLVLVNQFTCLPNCPNQTFKAPMVNSEGFYCKDCATHCLTCKDETICQVCQSPYVLQDGQCKVECDLGYRSDNGVCVKCSTTNCDKCTATACIQCSPTFFYDADANKCVNDCPITKYADAATKQCLHCNQFCDKCIDGTACLDCTDPFILGTDNKCTDKCPDGTVNINEKCTLCKTDDHCLKCDIDLTTCLQCKGSYVLLNNQCVKDCGDGYYVDNQVCYPCKNACKTCEKTGICDECIQGNFLLDHNCLTDCPKGYYKGNGQCVPCSSNCDQCNSTECLHCTVGYVLEKGKCVKNCSVGYYLSLQTECLACPEGCTHCSCGSTCTECAPGLFLSKGQCVSQCPDGEMPVNFKCTPCTDNCLKCGATVQECNQCKPGFYLKDAKCVKECPAGFYEDVDKCTACLLHCDQCQDKLTCDTCAQGFVYNAIGEIKRCDETCPEGYSAIEGKCVKCSADNCKKCDLTTSQCSICTDDSFLYNTNCIKECPSNTFIENKKCIDCLIECTKCSDKTTCNQCSTGFYLEDNYCISHCPEGEVPVEGKCTKCLTEDCSVCQPDTLAKCTQCKSGLLLKTLPDNSTICVEDCGEGYFAENNQCVKCNSDSCIKCSNTKDCEQCVPEKVLQSNVCKDKCDDFFVERNKECFQCKDLNCLFCDNIKLDTCSKCNLPYLLQEGQCVSECSSGYYVVDMTTQKQCLPCTDECEKCTNGDTCVKCDPSLALFNGKCMTKCEDGYIKINGECKKCADNHCKTCAENDIEDCLLCLPTFFLTEDDTCVEKCPIATYQNDGLCKPCTDDHCLTCAPENKCLLCEDGMFLLNDQCVTKCPAGTYADSAHSCQKCEDANCKECNALDGTKCLVCATGYLLEGKCVDKCPEGTYANSLSQCQKCNINCEKCLSATECIDCVDTMFLTDSKTCTDKCDDGYVAIGEKCTKCTDASCVKCSPLDITLCNECVPTMLLYKNKCVDACPSGTFMSGRNCVDCEDNCSKCTSTTECTQCNPSFNLYKADCIKTCPDGYTSIASTCTKCQESTCLQCKDHIDYCTQCQSPLLNDEGKCITQCEVGKFYNADKSKCDYCPTGCEKCSNAATCIKCDSNHVLLPETATCITECPSGTYEDMTNRKCVKCDNPTCKKCDPSHTDSCTECQSGQLFLTTDDYDHDKMCVDQCPPDFYQHEDECIKCTAPCKTCKDSSSCITCLPGFILQDGQCVSQCKEGRVERDGVCLFCQDDGCKLCDPTDLTKCLSCADPKILYQEDCIDKCPEHFYLSTANTCLKCDSTCDTCDGKGCVTCANGLVFADASIKSTCVKCEAPNVVIDSTCKKCLVDGCAQCIQGDQSTCSICQDGFVSFDNQCLANCPSGYYKSGTTCTKCDATCLECSSSTQCTKCIDGKIKYNGECIDQCPNYFHKKNDQCEQCSQPKCIHCDPTADQCTECKDVPLFEGKCVENCPDGYTLTGSSCTKCSTNCLKCDLSQCFQCTPGTMIKGNQCVSDCGTGFYSDGVTCFACTDSNCLTCTSAQTCTKCKNNTFLDTLTNTCGVACPNGYYGSKDTLECTKCSEGCAICDESKCIKCSDAYSFFDTQCVKNCPSGYTSVNEQCIKCTQDNCLECAKNDPHVCLKCKNYLLDTTCVDLCPIGTFVKENEKLCAACDNKCAICQDENTCTKCLEAFTLTDGQCLSKCADGKVKIGGKCVPCAEEDCKTCDIDLSTCLICIPPSVLMNSKCIEECPVGTYKDDSLNQCLTCPRSCAKCTIDQCQQCNPGYYMFQNQCVVNCPAGYYEDCSPDTRSCKPCDVSCEKCVLGTNANCITCSKNYFFLDNKCILPNECPKGTFYDGETCSKCNIPYCLTCSSSDVCFKCNRGFSLVDGQCVENHTLTPIIDDFILVSPFTAYTPINKQSEVFPIADFKGTGVGSSDVTISFYVRLLSPKIESTAVLVAIENGLISTYDFKFIIDATDMKCKMLIEDINKKFSYLLPVESCTYNDLFDWKFYSINFSQNGVDFIARVNTIDATGNVNEQSLNVPNNSRSNILEATAMITLNTPCGSNVAYHIGKLMIMDYYPSESQLISLSKLLPSKCDYFCQSCQDICLSCNGGILPVDDRCTANFISLNEGNPVYFDGTKSNTFIFRDTFKEHKLVSDAYGLTTWFYVQDTMANNQVLYQAHFNKALEKYQYLKVEIANGLLMIDGVSMETTQLKPNQWYFLYVANMKTGTNVIIKDTQKHEDVYNKVLPYFIRHYDDFIYEFGKNFKGSLFSTKVYINNLPSKEDLQSEFDKLKCPDKCVQCSEDLSCAQCIEGFIVTKGVCVEEIINVPYVEIENIYDLWNNNVKTYPVTSLSGIMTISLMIRKKTHSNIKGTDAATNVIFGVNSEVSFYPLIIENLISEYVSEFVLLSSKTNMSFKHDFTEEVYDFIHVMLTINNNSKDITMNMYDYALDKTIEVSTNLNCVVQQVVIGSQDNVEINMEISDMRLYEGELKDQTKKLIRKHPVPCSPTCFNCNWTNGFCNNCYQDTKPASGKCEGVIVGYHPASLHGYQAMSELPDIQEYKYPILSQFPVNVNADKYTIFFSAKFYRYAEGIKYRIGCIYNDGFRQFSPKNNRGKNLMCFDVYVKNAKGSLEMTVNDGGDFIAIPILNFVIAPMKWISGYIGVNCADKIMKYAFINDYSSSITGQYTYKHSPEKIQESAGITIYGVHDSLDCKVFAPPEIYIEHFYIYPFADYSETDLSSFLKEQGPREDAICASSCKICGYEIDEYTCIECKAGFKQTEVLNKKDIYDCQEIKYSIAKFKDEIITTLKDYPIVDSTIVQGSFAFYFQVIKNYLNNNLTSVRPIITIGTLQIALYKTKLYIMMTADLKPVIEIPLTNEYSSWNHVYLYKEGSGITITVKQGTTVKTATFINLAIGNLKASMINVNPANGEVYLNALAISSLNDYDTLAKTEPIGYDLCGLDCVHCEKGECKVCSLGMDATGQCTKTKIQLTPIIQSPNKGLVAQYDLFVNMDTKRFIRVDQFTFEFNVEFTALNDKLVTLLTIQDDLATPALTVLINNKKGLLQVDTMTPINYTKTTPAESNKLALPKAPITTYCYIAIAYNQGKMTVVYAENAINVISKEFTLTNKIAVMTHGTIAAFYSDARLQLSNLSFHYEQAKTMSELVSKSVKRTQAVQKNCIAGSPTSCQQCQPESILKNGICLPSQLSGFYSQLSEYAQVGNFVQKIIAQKFEKVPVLSSMMLSFNLRITSVLKNKLGLLSMAKTDMSTMMTMDYDPITDSLIISLPLVKETVTVTPVLSSMTNIFQWINIALSYSVTEGKVQVVILDKDGKPLTTFNKSITTSQSIDPKDLYLTFYYSQNMIGSFEYQGVVFIPNSPIDTTSVDNYHIASVQECKVGCLDCQRGLCINSVKAPFELPCQEKKLTGELFKPITIPATNKYYAINKYQISFELDKDDFNKVIYEANKGNLFTLTDDLSAENEGLNMKNAIPQAVLSQGLSLALEGDTLLFNKPTLPWSKNTPQSFAITLPTTPLATNLLMTITCDAEENMMKVLMTYNGQAYFYDTAMKSDEIVPPISFGTLLHSHPAMKHFSINVNAPRMEYDLMKTGSYLDLNQVSENADTYVPSCKNKFKLFNTGCNYFLDTNMSPK